MRHFKAPTLQHAESEPQRLRKVRQTMTDTRQPKEARELGFLDLLAIASGWWKALAIIPTCTAILVYIIFRNMPVSYSAQALISVSPDQIIQISQPTVLDPVVRVRNPNAHDEEAVAQVRRTLLANLKISPVPQTTFYYVVLDAGRTVNEATDTLNEIIGQFIQRSKPSGALKEALEADIQFLEDKFSTLQAGLQSQLELSNKALKSATHVAPPPTTITGPPPQIVYLNEISETRAVLTEKKNRLSGLKWDMNVIQSPALVVNAPVTKTPFAVAAAIGALFLTFLVALAVDVSRRLKAKGAS